MQSYVIREGEPHGVPLKFKFMPQLLADNLGYKAHAVGKWHLGHHRKVYLPTKRGFLSHFGYWSGMEDYYDHTVMSNKVINNHTRNIILCITAGKNHLLVHHCEKHMSSMVEIGLHYGFIFY